MERENRGRRSFEEFSNFFRRCFFLFLHFGTLSPASPCVFNPPRVELYSQRHCFFEWLRIVTFSWRPQLSKNPKWFILHRRPIFEDFCTLSALFPITAVLELGNPYETNIRRGGDARDSSTKLVRWNRLTLLEDLRIERCRSDFLRANAFPMCHAICWKRGSIQRYITTYRFILRNTSASLETPKLKFHSSVIAPFAPSCSESTTSIARIFKDQFESLRTWQKVEKTLSRCWGVT